MDTRPIIDRYLGAILSKYLTLYRYGAKGPDRFDCSGLVTWGLGAAGVFPRDYREVYGCDALWHSTNLLEIDRKDICDGDLVFYGKDNSPDHVMTAMGPRVYGACGGDKHTLNDALAEGLKAYVQWRSNLDYRPDFWGVRRVKWETIYGV